MPSAQRDIALGTFDPLRRIAAPEQIRQGSLSQPEIHPLPSNLMIPRISIVRSPGSNAPSASVATCPPQR